MHILRTESVVMIVEEFTSASRSRSRPRGSAVNRSLFGSLAGLAHRRDGGGIRAARRVAQRLLRGVLLIPSVEDRMAVLRALLADSMAALN